MSCGTGRFSAELFLKAMEDLDLWRAFFCPYAAPLGDLTVGTVVYLAFMLGIYIRTQSVMIPFILLLVFGGTVLAQMFAVISAPVAMLILIVPPLVVTAAIFLVDRRG